MKKLVAISSIFFSCYSQACTPFDTGKGLTTGSVHSPVVLWASWWCPPAKGYGEYTKGKGAVWIPSYYSSASDLAAFHTALQNKDVAWMEKQVMLPANDPQILRSIASPEARAKQLAAKPADYYPAVVAPNGTKTTRPFYPMYGTVRGSVEAGRVTIAGTKCSAVGYASFSPDFDPAKVTFCKAAP